MLEKKDARRLANLLDRSADHIDRVGLIKGTYFKGYGEDGTTVWDTGDDIIRIGHKQFKNAPCCSYGALFACARSEDDVHDAASQVMEDVKGYFGFGLDDWNDLQGRQKRHVVDAFRRTAQRLRGML